MSKLPKEVPITAHFRAYRRTNEEGVHDYTGLSYEGRRDQIRISARQSWVKPRVNGKRAWEPAEINWITGGWATVEFTAEFSEALRWAWKEAQRMDKALNSTKVFIASIKTDPDSGMKLNTEPTMSVVSDDKGGSK